MLHNKNSKISYIIYLNYLEIFLFNFIIIIKNNFNKKINNNKKY